MFPLTFTFIQVKASKLQAESDFHQKFLMQLQEISTLKSKVNEAEAQLELRKRTQYENSDYRKEVEELKMVLKEEQQMKKVFLSSSTHIFLFVNTTLEN